MSKPLGPIGLLLSQAHEKVVAIGPNFEMFQFGWPKVQMLECPLQELRPTFSRIARQARTKACTDCRKSSRNLVDLDIAATTCTYKKLTSDEIGIVKMVQQGATWDKKTDGQGESPNQHCVRSLWNARC